MEFHFGAGSYNGSVLEKLTVDNDTKRWKQVRDGLNNRIAKLPGEFLAKAIHNCLPATAKNKKVRVKVVYKVIDQFEKSDFRQVYKDERVFREKIREYLRSEIGRRWLNEWLTPVNLTEVHLPALPSVSSLGVHSPVPHYGPEIPELGDTASSGSTMVTLPFPQIMPLSARPSLATADQLLLPSQGVVVHRRRASDSILLPCLRCGSYHRDREGNIVPSPVDLEPIHVVPKTDNRGTGVIQNRLMMAISALFVACIALLFSFYRIDIWV
ncbi:hypothetical protein B0J11DRAFT_573376 [Dendryphion nanum]|uniref:Uncharacterized protein n=1 Tax=Dendryphion nanum TaxID=256645 RepID=A0A9P9D1A7_9PLEO|nr:hypothetical protein B0J11DRAFT_573376 [Dendryphion nanum]